MAYTLRWKKAAVVSLLCHLFFFASAGYLSAHVLTAPVIPEHYVELELMNESQPEALNTPSQAATTPSPTTTSTPSPQRTEQVAITPNSAPRVSVSTSAMSVVATDNPYASSNESASSSAAESSSAASSNNGGGNTPSSGSKGKGGGIIPPSILSKTEPSYPQSARQEGLEGAVILKIEILENGRAGNISVSRSSGHDSLDNAAIAALREWRFTPAKDRDSGHAITCYTTLPIAFRLH